MFEKKQSYGWIQQDNWKPAPLILFDMGVEQQRETSYYFDNRQRGAYNGFLFQYTIDGEGIWENEKEQYVLDKGCSFLTPIPDNSRYYLPEKENPFWSFFYIHFGGYVASQIVADIQKKYGSVLTFKDTPRFVRTFAKEHDDICSGKQYRSYEGSSFCYRLLTEILAELESGQSPCGGIIEKGYHWLSNNFTSPCSLSEMCEQFHVSLPHFSRQFHTVYGMTPHNYITKLRLEHAMSLLLNTSLSIQEIAIQSGFSEGNYFSKVFRKYTNMTPGDFRNHH